MKVMESCEKLAADNQGQSNPSLIPSVIRVMDRLGMIHRDSHWSQLLITPVSLHALEHFYLFFVHFPWKKKKEQPYSKYATCRSRVQSNRRVKLSVLKSVIP